MIVQGRRMPNSPHGTQVLSLRPSPRNNFQEHGSAAPAARQLDVQLGLMAESREKQLIETLRRNLRRRFPEGTWEKRSIEAGMGKGYLSDLINRRTKLSVIEIALFARAHKLSLDELLELPAPEEHETIPSPAVKVAGEVHAGAFMALDEASQDHAESPLPSVPAHDAADQFDLMVRGNSINRFAREGQMLRCIRLAPGREPLDDDLVIFERMREGDLIETTAKRFRRRGPTIELWPDSDDPRFVDPIRLDTRNPKDGERGKITGIVLFAYQFARRLRA